MSQNIFIKMVKNINNAHIYGIKLIHSGAKQFILVAKGKDM